MKKQTTYYRITTLVFTFVVFGLLLHSSLSKDDRTSHESFIVDTYQKAYLEKGELNSKKPDKPDYAALHEYLTTLDPNTRNVPKERLLKSYQFTKAQALKSKLIKKDGKDDIQWENVPANIAGRVRKIVFDPSDATHKKIWAGSVTGGLWFNNDATDPASSWENASGFFENLAVGAIAFDPDNNDIMYVGTGESYTAVNIYRESSGKGTGIWKSTDHGETWQLIPSSTDFAYVNDILIRNEAGINVVYAAVVSGTYKGELQGSNTTNGLYRSIDGGQTWTQVLPNIIGDTTPYAPSDIEEIAGGKLLVGTMRNTDENGAGVILSSLDGINWTINDSFANDKFDPMNNIYPGRIKFAVAPSNSNRVYAVISGGFKFPSGFIRDSSSLCILLQSFDAGATWSEFAGPSLNLGWGRWGSLTWHAMALGVDANDENTIMLGGFNSFKLTGTDTADNTETTGLKWQSMSYWIPNQEFYPEFVHADHHTIMYRPGSSDEVFISTDGGVFYSNDITSSNVAEIGNLANVFPSFVEVNKGLNTVQYYTVGIHPNKGFNSYYGGTQDNGTLRYDGSPIDVNDMVSGGDGAFAFVDINEPNIVITSVYHNQYIVSRDAGATSEFVNALSGTFINAADYNSITNTLFANGMGLGGAITSTDNQHIDELLRIEIKGSEITSKFTPLNTGSTVPYSSIKVSPYDKTRTSTLFIGTQSGKLFKTTNAQSDTPSTIEIGSDLFPPANISSIDLGENEEEILVTFSNYGISSVWYTNDGGISWIEKESNLPDMPIRWGLFNPFNSDEVWLATEIGVWSTDDIKSEDVEWFPKNETLANVRTDMIAIRKSDAKIVAATHGRGMFEATLNTKETPIEPTPIVEKETFIIYPNPTPNSFTINSTAKGAVTYQGEIYSVGGKIVGRFNYTSGEEINISISGYRPGIYLVNLEGNDGSQIITKMVKQ
ncbi:MULTISPECIES: T9SS type A sorting domain-containing protein [Aquimarina]|uniref:T9SS type A sorting domain-containing protein n=1 Tax=Aquimarina TaxID=290174 RepID=UPI000D68629B|nr:MULTISPECIES: T9SS type A sorting domain-containing protein [Aquimarina]